MVQRCDFHQALLLRDGAPPELVGTAQSGLSATPGIFTKCRAILFFKSWRRLLLPYDRGLHVGIPVSRTTNTSASSFPRQYPSRILSAALCGDSNAERLSANSPRIPSVTKTSVSPFATGSTAACSAGNCEPTTPPRSISTSCTAPFLAPARINAPCTFPTPAQVIMPCTGSSAPVLRTEIAVFAALAASSPCPIPSIAAIRIPFWLQQTRCRSPDSP